MAARSLVGVLAAITALASARPAFAGGKGSWPDPRTVRLIERAVRLPKTASPISQYDRYYAPSRASFPFRFMPTREVIIGLYLRTDIGDEDAGLPHTGKPTRIGRVKMLRRERDLPEGISDGGCMEVHVFWDPATAKVVGVECNGEA